MIDNRYICKNSQYSFCGNYNCRLSKYCCQFPVQHNSKKISNHIKKTAQERKLHSKSYVLYNCLFGDLIDKRKEYGKNYYNAHKKQSEFKIKTSVIYQKQCNQDCLNCIYNDCILNIPLDRIEYQRMYYEANKERLLKYEKRYKEEHREEIREKAKQYYQKNKELVKSKQKKYRETHKAQLREYYKDRNQQYKYKMNSKKRVLNCYYSQYECCGWKKCPLYLKCSLNPVTDNRNIVEPNKNKSCNKQHQIQLKMYNRLFNKL